MLLAEELSPLRRTFKILTYRILTTAPMRDIVVIGTRHQGPPEDL